MARKAHQAQSLQSRMVSSRITLGVPFFRMARLADYSLTSLPGYLALGFTACDSGESEKNSENSDPIRVSAC